MNTIRLRTIEGRRMRDPAHPKRAAIATGTVFDVPADGPHWNHWMRRLRDGDVEEVGRKVRVGDGRKVTIPAASQGATPQQFKGGDQVDISVLDPHWRLALDRGDAQLVPDDAPKPVNATASVAAANAAKPQADKE